MDLRELEAHRRARDRFFAEHYASPIPEDDLEHFTGLSYFEPNPNTIFVGSFTPSDGRRVDVPSTAGTSSPYHGAGTVDVDIDGVAYTLTVLDDGDGGMFIAFGDATNGHATYGGGRYLSVEPGPTGRCVLDFDLAHNPYCVYDDEFVCPLPPPGNRISAGIEAGERMYHRPGPGTRD